MRFRGPAFDARRRAWLALREREDEWARSAGRARSARAAHVQRERERERAVSRARQLVALHGSVAAARQALAAQLPAHDPYAEEDDDEVVWGASGQRQWEYIRRYMKCDAALL